MGIASDEVEERLAAHGYIVVRRTADHALYEHHGDHVVIPRHSRELSPWTARAIEWNLEPSLGRGWLSGPSATAPSALPHCADARSPTRLVLTLTVRAERPYAAWDAFVVEEPRIITFGATLAETRRRAADAAGAWFGDRVQVDLVPAVQLDSVAQQWLDHARTPAASADRVAEARRHLLLLGMADVDVTELLTPPRLTEAV